jgi:hypothetical protein
MFEIFGKPYYIDVDKIIEVCRPEQTLKSKKNNEEFNNKKSKMIEYYWQWP